MNTDNKIPNQIKKLAVSPEIYAKTEKIADKFNLHIDQLGELDAELTDIFLGKQQSKDFVEHLKSRLEINTELATRIAGEVNTEIFQVIRSSLQTQDVAKPANTANSSLERAGNFTIEPSTMPGSNSRMAMHSDITTPVTAAHRINLLDELENPTSNNAPGPKPVQATPPNLPVQTSEQAHYEPLVDQLLGSMSAVPQQKIEKKISDAPPMSTPPVAPPAVPTAAPAPGARLGPVAKPSLASSLPANDPYRETI